MSSKKDADTPRYKGSELIRTATGVTRDVLSVILMPDELYTSDEVAQRIQRYMNKEVAT